MLKYAKDQPAGFTNRVTRVAILGASGTMGNPITTALLRTHPSLHITALTRSTSTTSLPPGVHPIPVDYTSLPSLTTALLNHDILIITLSVLAPPSTHHNLVLAAAAAKIPYILPNAFSWYIPDLHASIRAQSIAGDQIMGYVKDIEEQGVSKWIAVCSSFWYEYSLAGGYALQGETTFGFDWKEKRVTLFDGGERKVNVSTWEQVGRAVARLVGLKMMPEDEEDGEETLEGWGNGPVRVSSFWVSQREMLESVQRVTGERWRVVEEGVVERYESAVEDMRKGERLAYVRAMYSRIFWEDAGREGVFYAGVDGCDNERLGLPKEDLDEATRRAVEIVKRGRI